MTAATQLVSLNASPRTESGKGAARRLRKQGQVPAVAYGKGRPATTLAVAPKEILTLLKSERGQNNVIQMKVGGKDEKLVMIRDYSYHPLTRDLEHVDFVEVRLDEEVTVHVPLLVGGKAAGVVAGGILRQVFRTLPVRCLPDRIPLKIEVDVTPLNLGEHISTQDLKLAEGVRVLLPAEQTLVAVVAPEKDRSEEAAAPGAPAAGAPAAGAAAPAAGGKAPAAAAAPAKDAKKK